MSPVIFVWTSHCVLRWAWYLHSTSLLSKCRAGKGRITWWPPGLKEGPYAWVQADHHGEIGTSIIRVGINGSDKNSEPGCRHLSFLKKQPRETTNQAWGQTQNRPGLFNKPMERRQRELAYHTQEPNTTWGLLWLLMEQINPERYLGNSQVFWIGTGQ